MFWKFLKCVTVAVFLGMQCKVKEKGTLANWCYVVSDAVLCHAFIIGTCYDNKVWFWMLWLLLLLLYFDATRYIRV